MPANLPERLARAIAVGGPMPVSRFMAAANAEYYAAGDPLGTAGDFITAPEINQMFGEIVGAWLGDLWQRAHRPTIAYLELGPGRGTLAADALRGLKQAGCEPPVHLIETSPALRAVQAGRLPDAIWHDDCSTLPAMPMLIVANEFFDALPVEQIVRGTGGWQRRLVASQDTLFLPIAGPGVPDAIIPRRLRDAPTGSILESSPAGVGYARAIAAHIVEHGGAALIVDYGYHGPALGETLQGVRAHGFANPFDEPGSTDLSAHVDFTTLAAAVMQAGALVHGPVSQRNYLGALGLSQRAASLARAAPEMADDIAAAYQRLTSPGAMGTLFRAMALTAPGWPTPAGFGA